MYEKQYFHDSITVRKDIVGFINTDYDIDFFYFRLCPWLFSGRYLKREFDNDDKKTLLYLELFMLSKIIQPDWRKLRPFKYDLTIGRLQA